MDEPQAGPAPVAKDDPETTRAESPADRRHGIRSSFYAGVLALLLGSLVLIVVVTAENLRRRGAGDTERAAAYLTEELTQENDHQAALTRALTNLPLSTLQGADALALDMDVLLVLSPTGRILDSVSAEGGPPFNALLSPLPWSNARSDGGYRIVEGETYFLTMTLRPDGTRLVTARRLDLEELGEHVSSGRTTPTLLSVTREAPEEGVILPLRDPTGTVIAHLVWSEGAPSTPFTQLAGSLLAALALLSLSAYLVWRRQRDYVSALDSSARSLAGSEARFRDFAESASDWFWETNADLEYTYISPRLAHLPRDDVEAILGISFRHLCMRNLDSEDWLDVCTANVVRHKAFRDLNLTTTLSSGERRHYRVSGRPVLGADGRFEGFRGSGIDVTRELQASDRVQAMRDLLIDAVGSISEGFVLFDPEGKLVVVNDQYRAAYPRLAAHLVPGVSFEDLLRIAAKGEDIRDESALRGWLDVRLKRHRDGGVTDCRLSNGHWYRISEHSTRGGGIVKVLMDITELKTKTDRLTNQTALLSTTFGAIDQGIAVFGADRRLKAFNPRLPDLMEYPADLCVEGRSQSTFLTHDRERGVGFAPLSETIDPAEAREAPGTNQRVAGEITLPSGKVLESHRASLPDGGYVFTVTDITDLKRQQRVLADLAASTAGDNLDDQLAGTDILALLAKGLGTALDMDRVVVAERGPDDEEGLLVLARTTKNGQVAPRTGEGLDGPLCAAILEEGRLIDSRGAWEAHGEDPLVALVLEGRPVESILAQALRGENGEPIGLIAALGTRPVENLAWARELLPVFAARAEAELSRQRAAVAAREGEALLRTFVEYTPAAVAMVDRDMRYLRVSRRWVRDFGLEGREIIGARHHEVLPDIPDDWRADYARALTGAVVDHDEVCLDLGGKTVWLRRQEHPWFRGDGSVGGIMMFAEVITDRKQAELALQQAQKMDAVGQLAGGIAHEFNNMLTSIGGFARMAARDPSNTDRVTMCLGEVTKSSDRAAALTTQLLNFSRRASSETIEPFPLSQALADLRAFLKPVLGEQVHLNVEAPDGPEMTVLVNPDRLHQALVNLCINARDAMPDGGDITISMAREHPTAVARRRHAHLSNAPYALLRVADSGEGISEENLPRVFEPFFTTKEQGKGTGLGLPMVYAMAEQVGGAVDVESAVGAGTCFTLYLPLTEEAGEDEAIPDIVAHGTGDAVILLVEDEESVRRYAQMVLEDHGYTVLTAENGRRAMDLWKTEKNHIDLLVTDLVMPEMGGPELIERVLRDREDLKVVLISGYSNHPAWTDGGDQEWRRLLGKPVRPETLLSTVEELLAR